MKTVMDAVNEFKGEWPKSISNNKGWSFGSHKGLLTYDGINVCSQFEFNRSTDRDKYSSACFDLMFYGCQTINAPQAMELLKAIESGKIHGVKWVGE